MYLKRDFNGHTGSVSYVSHFNTIYDFNLMEFTDYSNKKGES